MESNRKDRRKAASPKGKVAVKSTVSVGDVARERTNFDPAETLELQEMQRMCNMKRFEATQVAGNTALIPRGQEVAQELEAVARLLENSKNLWVSQKLRQHGYPQDTKCQVNLMTGEILVENPTVTPVK